MGKTSSVLLTSQAKALLEEPFWVTELQSETLYGRVHDDDDGKRSGAVAVIFDRYGDARIHIEGEPGEVLRYRTDGGGGRSLRVRTALMLLAYAIHLDNKDDPEMELFR